MTARFKIGDLVGGDAPIGEVVAYRDLGPRQLLHVKTPGGEIVTIVVNHARPGPEVMAAPSQAEAQRLAARILEGGDARMPVTEQLNILAAAVLGRTAQ